MKKLLFSIILICTISSVSIGQPPMGQPQTNQTPDVFIAVGTLNTDLVYKVSGREIFTGLFQHMRKTG